MLSDILFRLRALYRRSAVENELDEELRLHIERQVDKHIGAGLTRDEAERQDSPCIWRFGPSERGMPGLAWRERS